MKITDLTNDSPFIDLDLEEASNVIGGRGSFKAELSIRKKYLRAIPKNYRKRKPGRLATVEADNGPTVEPVGTGGTVSTDSGKAPIIRGPLYY